VHRYEEFYMIKLLIIVPLDPTEIRYFRYPKWIFARFPAFGAVAIVSSLRKWGYEALLIECRDILERCGSPDFLPHLIGEIRQFSPDIIGLSMMTSNLDQGRYLSDHIATEFPDVPQICGGAQSTADPQLTLELLPNVTGACVGQGEIVCREILEERRLCTSIKGLMIRGQKHRFSHRRPLANIDQFAFPDPEAIPIEYYTKPSARTNLGWLSRSFTIVTSRGCPYSCKFCSSGGAYNKPIAYHSSQYVNKLVEHCAGFGVDSILFMDDTLNVNHDRCQEILRGLISSNQFMPKGRLRWAGAIRANQVNSQLLRLMKQSGCFRLNIGVESGSDRMLQIVNKRTTVEMNMKAIRMVQDAGIDLFITLMIGIPGESKNDMMQTIDLMEKLQPATFGFSWFKPLPGSQFYNELLRAGRISKATFDAADIGNCNHFPDEIYCNVPRDEAKEIYDYGSKIAYQDNVLSVFDDVAQKLPETIDTITRDEDLRYISSDVFFSLDRHGRDISKYLAETRTASTQEIQNGGKYRRS